MIPQRIIDEAEKRYLYLPVSQGDYGHEQKYVKHDSKIDKYRKAFISGAIFNEERQGCRWVKASEPPKERTKNLIVRCQNKAGNVYNNVTTYDPEKIYAGSNWDCDNVVYWLDESEPCVDRFAELEKENDDLKLKLFATELGWTDALQKLKKATNLGEPIGSEIQSIEPCATSSDAIEFAEWIIEEGWNKSEIRKNKWYRKPFTEKSEYSTTGQLYQIFKQNDDV